MVLTTIFSSIDVSCCSFALNLEYCFVLSGRCETTFRHVDAECRWANAVIGRWTESDSDRRRNEMTFSHVDADADDHCHRTDTVDVKRRFVTSMAMLTTDDPCIRTHGRYGTMKRCFVVSMSMLMIDNPCHRTHGRNETMFRHVDADADDRRP